MYTEHELQLSTLKLFALIDEPAEGADKDVTVLLLHGITSHAYVWLPVMADLAKAGYRTIAIDQRGHGRSEKPQSASSYSGDGYVSDVKAIREVFGRGSFVVVGHSLGGRNALLAAVTYPESVDAAMILDYSPLIDEQTVIDMAARVETGNRTFANQDEVLNYLSQRYPRFTQVALRRRAEYGYRVDGNEVRPLANPDAMRATASGLMEDLKQKLTVPTIPVKFLRGRESLFVSVDAWRDTRDSYNSAQFEELDGVDHYLVEEMPTETSERIIDFIASTVNH